ncbi:MAG: AAA family ATPase [Hyphomicrobiaceae bacterium]
MAPETAALQAGTMIIGNSGSGKSTLAQQLAVRMGLPVVALDDVHWDGADYRMKRDEGAARMLIGNAALRPRWIIEGVYGWLADVALPRATNLIWLDLPWEVCRAGLMQRGLRPGGATADQQALLRWAEDYWTRATSTSFSGHCALYEAFAGNKVRLRTRDEIQTLLAAVP